jgi:hypothetical protein
VRKALDLLMGTGVSKIRLRECLETKQGTFEYAEEEIKRCYGHLIVWSRLLSIWCLIVAVAFHIDVIILLFFTDNAKIIHGQPLTRPRTFRRFLWRRVLYRIIL